MPNPAAFAGFQFVPVELQTEPPQIGSLPVREACCVLPARWDAKKDRESTAPGGTFRKTIVLRALCISDECASRYVEARLET
jgi:hypothetical protein